MTEAGIFIPGEGAECLSEESELRGRQKATNGPGER